MDITPEWPVLRRLDMQLRKLSNLYDLTSFSANMLFYTCHSETWLSFFCFQCKSGHLSGPSVLCGLRALV